MKLNSIKSLILIILGVSLFACNPVKQVIKDQEKLDKVAEEVIRRGYCRNDTTIVTHVSDTIYVEIEDDSNTLWIGEGICDFDTVLASGTNIVFIDGYLYVTEKIKYKTSVITKNVDNYIKDVAFEDILKKDITSYRDSVSNLKGMTTVYEKQLNDVNQRISRYKLYFYGLIIAVIVGVVLKVVKTIKPI
jgi:predicted DNA binding CopG/RHH family protein